MLVAETCCNWDGNIDGRCWRCNGRDCRRAERLRSGSIFATSHLLLQKLVRLAYLHSIRFTKEADLIFQLDINSQHSIIEWKCNIRNVFAQYFIAHPQTVGSFDHMMEIDKCLLEGRKSQLLTWISSQFYTNCTIHLLPFFLPISDSNN